MKEIPSEPIERTIASCAVILDDIRQELVKINNKNGSLFHKDFPLIISIVALSIALIR